MVSALNSVASVTAFSHAASLYQPVTCQFYGYLSATALVPRRLVVAAGVIFFAPLVVASLSIANGADIVSVSNKLGHSTVSITLDIYSHANARAQLRANEVLAAAIY